MRQQLYAIIDVVLCTFPVGDNWSETTTDQKLCVVCYSCFNVIKPYEFSSDLFQSFILSLFKVIRHAVVQHESINATTTTLTMTTPTTA